MKFKFEIDETRWNYVKEKGLPEDDGFCIVIWKMGGTYDYHMGSYCEVNHQFYVNFGLGGMVLDADSVVAWAPLFDEDNYLQILED